MAIASMVPLLVLMTAYMPLEQVQAATSRSIRPLDAMRLQFACIAVRG